MKISCQRFAQKCVIGLFCFLLTSLALLFPAQIFAAERSSYYDWGPYYNQTKVLGITFSSLEELPKIEIPANISPPPATGILPGNPLHFFETLTENIQLTFTFDAVKKEEFRFLLASERLSEAKTLVEQGNYQAAETAAAEYRNTMNAVSDNLQALSAQNNPQATVLAENLEKLSADHAIVAQAAALSSPSAANTTWNKLLTASEKAMDAAAETRGQPAIPEELSVSLQELKNDGLITPEQSDKLYSLTSRSQVRAEIDKLATAGTFPQTEAAKLDTAVADNYPDIYNQTLSIFKFAELRSYQTLPPPTNDVQAEIEQWQNQSADTPPPGEIRPYLYYSRAQELAKEIDFGRFDPKQQSEVARFYPESAVQNPTFSGTPPSPSPSPSPSPTTAGTSETGEALAPSPSPSPTPPPIGPYLTDYKGPLPGTFGYFFKNLGEQAALATTFNAVGRLELEMSFADERLREANALAQDKGKAIIYKDMLIRYGDAIERVANDVKNFGGKEEDKRDLARALESESARHNVIFEKGLLPPPTGDTKVYTAAINATEDAMDKTSDVLGRPALPKSLVNRLQDMKAQGIILGEEVSDLTNASSREEVRKKIRELSELGTFPPADAKKLDEAQSLVAPSDFNQLIEIRKIEELQSLRSIQAEFAQTATLRETGAGYEQRVKSLLDTIDPSLIRVEDLAGREELIKTYREIAANAPKRPINGGQFGTAVVPGAPLPEPPSSSDAIPGICPIGSFFKQSEGCVWQDSGKRIDDVAQYTCESSAQYWSFAAKACVYTKFESPGTTQDGNPDCPIGYAWSWETRNCQLPALGSNIFPSPQPSLSSKSCPEGASYKAPQGCVWDENDKPVYDGAQYRCGQSNYYSFTQNKCVPLPEPEISFPDDGRPNCKENGEYWNWSSGKCIPKPKPVDKTLAQTAEILTPKPYFVAPDSPFYFLKQAAEAVQVATAIAPKAREEVKLAQAKERIAEAYALLEKNNKEGFKDSLSKYTGAMQAIYNDIDKGLSLSDEAKKELGEKLAEEVTEQNLLLQKVSVLASKDAANPISAATSVITQGVDRASDLEGQPPIPKDLKEKLDALPEGMLTDEQKQKLTDADTRLEARLITGELTATGALTQADIAFMDNWMAPEDTGSLFTGSVLRLNEIKKLSEAVELTTLKEDIAKKVEKTENIAEKLDEFKKSFEPGQEIPPDVRPYIRLTRIDEISKTIRPDAVRLEDFGNRKDIQLAVATLQQEFRPTREDFRRLEDFRRGSPGRALPPELARIEALSFSIGVRDTATACFLPSPPFAPNTPCPPTGASISISSYYSGASSFPGIGGFGGERLIVDGEGFKGWRGGSSVSPSVDKDGNPLVYGKGPEADKPGVCPDGFHWMYDSGGWCMSNSGNYSSGTSYSQAPYSSGPNYTPYTPYYSAPGSPPYGYSGPGNYQNFINAYSPPNYYGTAPTTYTTNPPAGTVPGTGPAPTAPGQCPSGFHWMPPSAGQAGWCMSNGGTYVGGGGEYGGGGVNPPQSCPSGSYWSYYSNSCVTANFTQGFCGAGYYQVGDACAPSSSLGGGGYGGGGDGGYYGGGGSPSSYQYGCTPGSYWDGSRCVAGNYEGSNWSDTAARSQTWCQAPSSGCGSNSYWDYGSCSCRTSSYYGGSGGSSGSCSPPSGGCGSGWFDSSSCSCKQASSQGCYNVSASSCGTGFYWDSGACTCRSTSNTSTYTAPSSSGSTSSGSCPSGYHWMSDSGGWCMSDGTSGGGSTSTYTPPPTTTSTEPTPAPTTTTTEPAPAPTTTEPAPAPSSPAPAPTTSP